MGWQARPITEWLQTEGIALPDLDALTAALGAKLIAAGAPVWRLRIAMRTLHPLVTAVSTIWERDAGPIGAFQSPHGLEQRDAFHGSPMAKITDSRQPLRKDLTALVAGDHAAFHELRDRGASDYFGVPLVYGEKIKVADIALDGDAWPLSAKLASNNFANQFQLPILFYALAAINLATQQTALWLAILAVLFVITRYIHTAIHITKNRVFRRFFAYVTGMAILAIMWLGFAVQTLIL